MYVFFRFGCDFFQLFLFFIDSLMIVNFQKETFFSRFSAFFYQKINIFNNLKIRILHVEMFVESLYFCPV